MSFSRRSFLKWGGLSLFCFGAGLSVSANPMRVPLATGGSKVLVVVFLRGGLDGMHALVPYGEKEYYKSRPNLAVPPPTGAGGSLVLDEKFSLNPALKALHPLFQNKSLACVCAIGTEDRSRSHFIAQDYLEFGGEKPRDGWLNRKLTDKGFALSTSSHLPTLLKGKNPVINATGVDDLLASLSTRATFAESHPVAKLSREEEKIRKRLSHLKKPNDSGRYPETSLGRQLQTVAYLIKQGVELEAAHCEIAGFDSHSLQIDGLWPGSLFGLNLLLHEFAEAVSAFWNDLGDLQERVTLMTVTEFGRRLQENGSLGTDHGMASASFILGGNVKGGEVYGRWPGLEREQLIDGIDLAVTSDYRGLLNEYADSCGKTQLFPEFAGGSLGVFRG